MDRFDSMSVFAAAAEAGSLSAAGRRLNMPLASVSRKVSDLESHLGARLFDRLGRRLRLTDAGQSYLAACKRILEEIGEAERAASGEYAIPRGHLSITAPIVFGRRHVLPVVTDFLSVHQLIDIRMHLADRIVDIAEDHVDAAIRIGHLADSAMTATRLGDIRRVVCASPAYFSARGLPRTPADLGGHDCIDFFGAAANGVWEFQNGRVAEAVTVRPRLAVNTAEAAIDAALTGLGVTRVLSYQIADAVRAGALQLALETFERPAMPVHLVFAGQRLLPRKLRAFIDFAGPRLRGELARFAGSWR